MYVQTDEIQFDMIILKGRKHKTEWPCSKMIGGLNIDQHFRGLF